MKRNTKKIKISLIVVIFFIFSLLSIYYVNVINPVIKSYSAAETKAITEKAVNLAVSNVINRTISYDTLMDINYNSNGEIVSFSANQYEINSISREIVKETQYQINNIGQDGLKLNIGTFSGIPILIGRGPKITLKLVPIGAVGSKFESRFDSVGINMTKHTLFLYVDVHVNIVLPVKAYDVHSVNQVLLAESIIMGKVPDVYFDNSNKTQT